MEAKNVHPIIDRYRKYSRSFRNMAPKTMEDYVKDLSLFYRYIIMAKKELKSIEQIPTEKLREELTKDDILSITRDDVMNFIMYLEEDRHAEASSRNRRIAAISSFYKYLREEENHNIENPTNYIPHAKLEKKEAHFLDIEECLDLLYAAKTKSRYPTRDVCILTFFLHLGIRREELCGINMYDIKKEHIVIYGKGRKERFVPFDEACRKALDDYLPNRINPKDSLDEDALFTNNRGQRLTPNGVWRMVKKTAKEAGIGTDIAPHALRHTFATLMLTESEDIVTLKEIMGHESIETTNKYLHYADKKKGAMVSNNPLNSYSRQLEMETK